MDITIPKSELARALYFTQSIVEKRTTMPILANVLLSASNGKLQVSATDLEITATVSAPAEVRTGGSTTVNARILTDIVRELPETEIKIVVSEGERLEISALNSRLKMIGVSAEEYPSLPGVNFETKGRVNAKEFLDMVNKTMYAVSQDETRFNLSGVCFDLITVDKKKQLRLVATDGHRLALVTRPIEGVHLTEKVIVPKKGLAEVKKALEERGDGEVGFDVKEGFLIVESGNAKVATRLIDGEFPDYEQVIPKKKGVDARILNKDLAQALRRVALMVTDKGKCVKLDFAKDELRISSSSPELGEATEKIGISYAGQQLSVGFNARYLLDFTASLEESQALTLELHGELGPGKLSAEGDDSYIGIVMPMRLS